ncbi:hypothetical protein [Methyloglobulus sp.]|uniref:hypothetical protein n=1 Tax=Methyloglobulus sp. TaxID=2518622 RepID=UPI0032B7FB0E
MNIKLIKFLGVLCAALCFIIICEWLYAIYAQNQLLASIQAVDKQKKSAIELPSIELTKQPESSYVDLVARPLFIQGRKPVNEPSAVTTPVTTATENFNWALNGVYTHKKSLYALFSRTTAKVAKDNYRKVTKDNDIDGWKLTEIHNDKVVVSQGGKQKELPLRKPKPKNPANNMGSAIATPPMPGQQPGQPFAPNQQPIPIPEQMPEPEPIPEPIPEPEPMLEPELIPDDSSEPFFENSENEQFQ